ncbi:hypothetical protein DXG01_003239 [Tephrocybe rancida]|nr:hypothetical protein DXG01_003239 [Tephrocybe rancida]
MVAEQGSWVKGNKLTYLERLKDKFLKAQDGGVVATGRFYTSAAHGFVRRWLNLPLDVDGPMVAEDDSLPVIPDTAMEEEKEEIRKQIAVLHDAKTTSEVEDVLKAFRDGCNTERPQKQAALALYSSKYYKSRFKAEVDQEWAKAMKEGTAVRSRLTFLNDIVCAAFNCEPASVRESFENETEEAYRKEMDAYSSNTILFGSQTPEEYNNSMENSATTLLPLADALVH